MFTPFKSNTIKFILSATIIVGSLSSCAREQVEETRREIATEESVESSDVSKIANSNFQDTVVYPVDPVDGSEYMLRVAGNWDMTSLNEQNVDYKLELYKDGTYQIAPDEAFTRGATKGDWNIDSSVSGTLYLYLGGLYESNTGGKFVAEPTTRNKFEITTFSDDKIVIINAQNDSFILTRN
ncbi:hypothetical protein WAF17_02910 [Bernardetia sp. ABR2-2B]|uniref:hypothetical protein n=1 Tax=Bernardetia sp. ABR2-2B TaxID=3127472 RepID=UPI0030D4B4F6